MTSIVPLPVSLSELAGDGFRLTSESRIVSDGAAGVVGLLAAWLRPATGFALDVVDANGETLRATDIVLRLSQDGAPADHATEGYRLRADAGGAVLTAATPAGLFAAAQTLRQLFPSTIESPELVPGVLWSTPAVAIEDYPRFAYRGAMLDVARHFFSVEAVERYIDEITMLKLNHLHLHLTDDQGWRIQIDSRSELTVIGGRSEIGGGPGGFYSKADFARIVAYAAERFVTIVPEIDLPGHTNAALASSPELNCDGVAPALYTGSEVGFSSVCVEKEETYRFVEDVVRELAEMTPGPYLHLGGDESLTLDTAGFVRFIERATAIGAASGKTIIGWHEMGQAGSLPAGTVGQYWDFTIPRADAAEHAHSFVRQGGQLIMSPADVSYLDMVYLDQSRLGQDWAGATSVREAYLWDPAGIVAGIGDEQILGVEAPIWTETLAELSDVEFMAFPRLASIAEIAWSAAPSSGAERDYEAFAPRVVTFCARLEQMGVTVHRASELPW